MSAAALERRLKACLACELALSVGEPKAQRRFAVAPDGFPRGIAEAVAKAWPRCPLAFCYRGCEQVVAARLAAGVSEQTRTTSGVVVKTGTGRIAADGASVPVPVQVGESVKFKDYAGADIRLDGEDYIVVRVPDCLAKWTE